MKKLTDDEVTGIYILSGIISAGAMLIWAAGHAWYSVIGMGLISWVAAAMIFAILGRGK